MAQIWGILSLSCGIGQLCPTQTATTKDKGTMKKILVIFAVALLAMALPLSAAITWGPWTETATTLSGSASWTGAPAPETASVTTPGGNWWVELVFQQTVLSYSVTMHGQHLVAPHLTDTSPSEVIELGNIFSRVIPGSGMAKGDEAHNKIIHNDHIDKWSVHEQGVAAGGVDVQFDARHIMVPEPATYALIAGIGLVGFAALRRFRR